MAYDPSSVADGNKRIYSLDADDVDTNETGVVLPVEITYADFDEFFTETAGSPPEYKKISAEQDGSQIPIEVSPNEWNYDSGTPSNSWAVLYIPVDADTSTGAEITISADGEQDDNTTYVGLTSDGDSVGVYSSDYAAVYHLAQDPSGGSGSILDSTSNAEDATPSNFESGDLVDAEIGKGLDLDGTNEYITTPAPISNNTADTLAFQSSDDFSLVCAYKGTDTDQNSEWGKGLINLGESTGKAWAGFVLRSGYAEYVHYTTSWQHNIQSTTIVADGDTHVVGFSNNGTAETGKLFVDGAKEINGLDSSIGSSKYFSAAHIGTSYAGGSSVVYTDGIISEAMIISGEMSETWFRLTAKALLGTLWTVSPVGSAETYMSLVAQHYSLQGTKIIPLEQPYSLGEYMLVVCEQLYGIQILAIIEQLYGDAYKFTKLVDQYYGNAAALIRWIDQRYGNANQFIAMVDQQWHLYDLLIALRDQLYSISGGQYIIEFDQHYALDQYGRYRQVVEQPYVMFPDDDAIEQHPTVTVTTATGVVLEPHHILIECDENEYTISGEIHLKDQAQFVACRHMETEVDVVIGSTSFYMLVEGPYESEPGIGERDYIVPIISPTATLDAPYADTLSQEIDAGQASDIVADLAGSISVSWALVDWYIPAGTIYANDEPPCAIIRKIVEAAGGVVQTAPDGSLICRPEYPDSVNVWGNTTPDQYYTDQDNFYSVDSAPEIRDGYNQFTVSNEDTLDYDLQLEEEAIDERAKNIKLFQVPLDDTETINLSHSGGSWVTIANDGLTSESITEEIEIVGGEGTTTNPVYALASYDYRENNLGEITYHEDGLLQTATTGNGLVEVTYTTMYRQYMVYDPRVENVQFYVEEV